MEEKTLVNVSGMLKVYDLRLTLAQKWSDIAILIELCAIAYAYLAIFNLTHEWVLSFLDPLLFSPVTGRCVIGIAFLGLLFGLPAAYHTVKSVMIIREIKKISTQEQKQIL